MLAQRLRRWPNIKASLIQRVVLAGICLLLDVIGLLPVLCRPHRAVSMKCAVSGRLTELVRSAKIYLSPQVMK